jgi:hypothetical protein
MTKLHSVHSEIHEWDQNVLKAPRKKISDLTKELNQLLSEPMGTDNTQQQAEVTRLIEIALEQEEMHYMQRSRAN